MPIGRGRGIKSAQKKTGINPDDPTVEAATKTPRKLPVDAFRIDELPAGLRREVAAFLQIQYGFSEDGLPLPKVGISRLQDGVMNPYERAFRDLYLIPAVISGHIAGWWFEPMKVRLSPNSYVTPDFLIQTIEGFLFWLDTKAMMADGSFISEGDASVKYRYLCDKYPFPLLLCGGRNRPKKDGGGWLWRGKWNDGIPKAMLPNILTLLPGVTDETNFGNLLPIGCEESNAI